MARRTIFKRQAAENRQRAAVVTSQTRWLYAGIYGAAGDEHAGERAQKIDLVPRPSSQTARKPKPRAASVDDAIAAFGTPEWGVEPDGR